MTQDLSECRQEIVDLTNALRREHGLPKLSVDERLMEAAQSCSAQGFTTHHNREECEAVLESGYPYGFGSNLTVFTARRKILCKRFSTKSRMVLESRADSGLNPLITESHGGQNGMRAGTA